MASRDEILMNFMAATGSEDFGKAFQLLESTDWNFENALGLFHATDDDHPDPNKILENDFKPAANPFDLLQQHSSSNTNNASSTSSRNTINQNELELLLNFLTKAEENPIKARNDEESFLNLIASVNTYQDPDWC